MLDIVWTMLVFFAWAIWFWLMITGGKVGALIGRKRAFAIGCVIYGTGSFITAIVALVAANFGAEGRPRAWPTPASWVGDRRFRARTRSHPSGVMRPGSPRDLLIGESASGRCRAFPFPSDKETR